MMGAPGGRVQVGSYELLTELAGGGMATVYLARQAGAAGFERLVVVKRVHPHLLRDHYFHDLFRDEARVASLIRHPNVVSVSDVVEAAGELFLVMEYIESISLAALLRTVIDAGACLPPAVGARIVADALAGLSAAHQAVDLRGVSLSVVHRDVSPQNILVGVDGACRLIDFGIAKAADRITETHSRGAKGKLSYMSPEQARGQEVDQRTDLFAAGIVLHEALTARRLFGGDNDLETLRRLTESLVAAPSTLATGVPPALDQVVLRALARDPLRRYQTAAAFLEALERAIQPAPSREVAACLDRWCGAQLRDRREKLQRLLEGSVVPHLRGFTPSNDPFTGSVPRPSPSQRSLTPSAGRDGGGSTRPEGVASDGSGSGATGVPTVAGHDAHPPRRRRLGLVAGGVVAAAAAVAGAMFTRGAPPPADPAVEAPKRAASAPSPGERSLADGRGPPAVAEEGGAGERRAEVDAGAATAPSPAVPTAAAVQAVKAVQAAQAAQGAPRTSASAASPRRPPAGGELHDNPYGPP